jgi:hypothetical protein
MQRNANKGKEGRQRKEMKERQINARRQWKGTKGREPEGGRLQPREGANLEGGNFEGGKLERGKLQEDNHRLAPPLPPITSKVRPCRGEVAKGWW